jgi:hydroxypyruvate isomerase
MQRSAVVGGALAGLGAVGVSTACATGGTPVERATSEGHVTRTAAKSSTIKQSVCRWCFNDMPLDELAANAKRIGLHSVELIGPTDFATIKQHGLMCAMVSQAGPGGIPKGWNRVDNHSWLIPAYEERIAQVAAEKWPNVICFSGNRDGLGDQEGLENCAKGLKQLMPAAEKAGVTVCMELLNSKVNHPDYQCDHTPWGVKLVEKVGSERFKLLYDIYHMQIMEGDVIRTIQDNIQYIAHFHTGGVPGRNEIDDTQELNYRRIAQAIADTGFKGFFAHEFIPKRQPLASLEEAVRLCTV